MCSYKVEIPVAMTGRKLLEPAIVPGNLTGARTCVSNAPNKINTKLFRFAFCASILPAVGDRYQTSTVNIFRLPELLYWYCSQLSHIYSTGHFLCRKSGKLLISSLLLSFLYVLMSYSKRKINKEMKIGSCTKPAKRNNREIGINFNSK
jgi:hypothetical protein